MSDLQLITLALELKYESTTNSLSPQDIAKELNLSIVELDNVFMRWAHTNFNDFTELLSARNIKTLLSHTNQLSLFLQTKHKSSWGQQRNLNILRMTSQEQNNPNLELDYNFYLTPFGQAIAASSTQGVCYISFDNNKIEGLKNLRVSYPEARLTERTNNILENAIDAFHLKDYKQPPILLHIKGTDFQLKVWQYLTQLPIAQLSTYLDIAQNIESPKSYRAVGSAVGKNPIAYLIPCHRIVRSTGVIGDYIWGTIMKRAIIGWELGRASRILNK